MGLVKYLSGPLLVSAWLLTHALFMLVTEPLLQSEKDGIKDIQQLIPIRLRECLTDKLTPLPQPNTKMAACEIA